jgi:hypothetical protein
MGHGTQMRSDVRRTVSGTVVQVQETRMTIVDDAGAGRLFLLGHASLAEPSQLAELQRRQARVRVTYRQAPDLIAHIATLIEVE